METEELLNLYQKLRPQIESRVEEFRRLKEEGTEEELFKEACFCLFTPQSKAVNCWQAVEKLHKTGLLYSGDEEEIAKAIRGLVRFHNTKAARLVLLRRLFSRDGKLTVREVIERFPKPTEARNWLVENVKGYGLKEASHFLRNTGYGLELAIVDRHIVKNLHALGAIEEIPSSITPATYLEIEERMRRFAKALGLPLQHLDLLLWAKEAGFVFK